MARSLAQFPFSDTNFGFAPKAELDERFGLFAKAEDSGSRPIHWTPTDLLLPDAAQLWVRSTAPEASRRSLSNFYRRYRLHIRWRLYRMDFSMGVVFQTHNELKTIRNRDVECRTL